MKTCGVEGRPVITFVCSRDDRSIQARVACSGSDIYRVSEGALFDDSLYPPGDTLQSPVLAAVNRKTNVLEHSREVPVSIATQVQIWSWNVFNNPVYWPVNLFDPCSTERLFLSSIALRKRSCNGERTSSVVSEKVFHRMGRDPMHPRSWQSQCQYISHSD